MIRLLSTVAAISFATVASATPFYVGTWTKAGVPCALDPYPLEITETAVNSFDLECRIKDVQTGDDIQVAITTDCAVTFQESEIEADEWSFLLDYQGPDTMALTSAFAPNDSDTYVRCEAVAPETREH